MNVSALLTSAGINTAVCVGLFSLYSILRKQPSLVNVYFGQRLSQAQLECDDPFWFDRLVPSASWIVKAWTTPEEEIFTVRGLDAVVFLRSIVFSIRVFSIAAIVCLSLVLPLNYFGQDMQHKLIPAELLEVFTIQNVGVESKWLWVHCLALYVISCCTCILLYFEYKSITKMRLASINASLASPRHYTVLIRAIPRSPEESYSDSVAKYFSDFYAPSYISYQMVYQPGKVQKLMTDAEKMYKMFKSVADEQHRGPSFVRCGLCGGSTTPFNMLSTESEIDKRRKDFDGSDLRNKECAAALVFFRTRYAALVASQGLQSPNPMLWVTDPAPEPGDIYWLNLCVPYRILWIRRISILVASIALVLFFLVPVAFAQSLVHIEKVQKRFPFLRGMLKRKFMIQLVTGYLPSVILILFLYIAPPLMILFSTMEGSISRSIRKRNACIKFLYFLIWNVFFLNIASDSVLERLGRFFNPRDIPNLLARAVSRNATFYMTYVMTSGWASVSCELVQPFGLICNLVYRYILRNKDASSYGTYTFPYHTEIPRILLFGLLGFTCCIFAPLILPFLLLYFFLAYIVYRNQILNVYITKYETGGLYWPIVHNTTIFSLVLTQIIALGIFGLKKAPTASSFTIPLIICTLLFNQYCRQRFLPVFKNTPAQILIEMDRKDELSGNMEEIYQTLQTAYCQFPSTSLVLDKPLHAGCGDISCVDKIEDPENITPGRRSTESPRVLVESSSLEIEELQAK